MLRGRVAQSIILCVTRRGIITVYTAIQEMRDKRGERLILHSPNIVNLCIDSYDDEKQCGRLYHQYTDHMILFSSLFEALDRMDRMYDEIQFPQAAVRFRSFNETRKNKSWCNGNRGRAKRPASQGQRMEPEEMTAPHKAFPEETAIPEGRQGPGGNSARPVETFDQVIGHRGEDATFIIRVQYRQYSSWQGEVTWLDGESRLPVGSVLELVRFIDNAMNASEKGATGSGRRSRLLNQGIGRENGIRADAFSTVNGDGR